MIYATDVQCTRLLLHLHLYNLLDGTDEEAVERVLLATRVSKAAAALAGCKCGPIAGRVQAAT